MCMSPDKMSDERLREAVVYYRNAAQQERDEYPGDPYGDARRWDSRANSFAALLAEREAQRVTDVKEIFTAVVVQETPELVSV